MTKRRKDRGPLRTAAALGDRHSRVGCPSAAPPSEAPGMPLNLDLAPGKVILLNYPESMEGCLLPSGGEGLLFFSGAAVTIEGIPVASNNGNPFDRVQRPGGPNPSWWQGSAPSGAPRKGSSCPSCWGGSIPWCPLSLDTSLQSLCQSSHGLLPVCVCVQIPLFL